MVFERVIRRLGRSVPGRLFHLQATQHAARVGEFNERELFDESAASSSDIALMIRQMEFLKCALDLDIDALKRARHRKVF